jgi:chromate transporter
MRASTPRPGPSLIEIARAWGRIGTLGFGGPPAHIALLRELCVQRRRWLSDAEFERAVAAANMLPGPASTQLAIYCAWRLRGPRGALTGGLAFILPGLAAILALAALFLSSPPTWVRGAGIGAGAAVPAVAARAGIGLAGPLLRRTPRGGRARVLAYGLAGAAGAALVGPWLVLVLLGCGVLELARARAAGRAGTRVAALGAPAALTRLHGRSVGIAWLHRRSARPATAVVLATAGAHSGRLAWTALKVGGLAFGGGFVIVPLMQSDATGASGWMTHGQFLGAVALGQVTPGPVTHTIAAVGYAASGVPGALLATAIAFTPSFAFVLLGAGRFERLLADTRARAFLAGASPAAAGAIIGAAVPLAEALSQAWQFGVLAAAALALFVLRRGIVSTLLLAGLAGTVSALAGAPIPH